MKKRNNAEIFSDAIENTFSSVGVEAFRALCKVCVDGVPAGFGIHGRIPSWDIDALSKPLSKVEAELLAKLALRIEEAARESFVKLLLNAEFRNALSSDLKKGELSKMSEERSLRRTGLFRVAIQRYPELRTKEILKMLEQEGSIIDSDDVSYVIAETGEKVKKSTLPSSFSKLRKGINSSLVAIRESQKQK